MPTKFVNILETSKLRILGQYLDSISYVLLHFLTLRLFENLAPGGFTPGEGWDADYREGWDADYREGWGADMQLHDVVESNGKQGATTEIKA